MAGRRQMTKLVVQKTKIGGLVILLLLESLPLSLSFYSTGGRYLRHGNRKVRYNNDAINNNHNEHPNVQQQQYDPYNQRVLVTTDTKLPLVESGTGKSFDCTPDGPLHYRCYYNGHDYTKSLFQARCTSNNFVEPTNEICQCYIDVIPSSSTNEGYPRKYEQCSNCGFVPSTNTTDGIWDVTYDCSNLLNSKESEYLVQYTGSNDPTTSSGDNYSAQGGEEEEVQSAIPDDKPQKGEPIFVFTSPGVDVAPPPAKKAPSSSDESFSAQGEEDVQSVIPDDETPSKPQKGEPIFVFTASGTDSTEITTPPPPPPKETPSKPQGGVQTFVFTSSGQTPSSSNTGDDGEGSVNHNAVTASSPLVDSASFEANNVLPPKGTNEDEEPKENVIPDPEVAAAGFETGDSSTTSETGDSTGTEPDDYLGRHGFDDSLLGAYEAAETTTSAPIKPTGRPIEPPTTEPTTSAPIAAPTKVPITSAPTTAPTSSPTFGPTSEPTLKPTKEPISKPTKAPISKPTIAPISEPTKAPISKPTKAPISKPTTKPTGEPSQVPIATPTGTPTKISPTAVPTDLQNLETPPTEPISIEDKSAPDNVTHGLDPNLIRDYLNVIKQTTPTSPPTEVAAIIASPIEPTSPPTEVADILPDETLPNPDDGNKQWDDKVTHGLDPNLIRDYLEFQHPPLRQLRQS